MCAEKKMMTVTTSSNSKEKEEGAAEEMETQSKLETEPLSEDTPQKRSSSKKTLRVARTASGRGERKAKKRSGSRPPKKGAKEEEAIGTNSSSHGTEAEMSCDDGPKPPKKQVTATTSTEGSTPTSSPKKKKVKSPVKRAVSEGRRAGRSAKTSADASVEVVTPPFQRSATADGNGSKPTKKSASKEKETNTDDSTEDNKAERGRGRSKSPKKEDNATTNTEGNTPTSTPTKKKVKSPVKRAVSEGKRSGRSPKISADASDDAVEPPLQRATSVDESKKAMKRSKSPKKSTTGSPVVGAPTLQRSSTEGAKPIKRIIRPKSPKRGSSEGTKMPVSNQRGDEWEKDTPETSEVEAPRLKRTVSEGSKAAKRSSRSKSPKKSSANPGASPPKRGSSEPSEVSDLNLEDSLEFDTQEESIKASLPKRTSSAKSLSGMQATRALHRATSGRRLNERKSAQARAIIPGNAIPKGSVRGSSRGRKPRSASRSNSKDGRNSTSVSPVRSPPSPSDDQSPQAQVSDGSFAALDLLNLDSDDDTSNNDVGLAGGAETDLRSAKQAVNSVALLRVALSPEETDDSEPSSRLPTSGNDGGEAKTDDVDQEEANEIKTKLSKSYASLGTLAQSAQNRSAASKTFSMSMSFGSLGKMMGTSTFLGETTQKNVFSKSTTVATHNAINSFKISASDLLELEARAKTKEKKVWFVNRTIDYPDNPWWTREWYSTQDLGKLMDHEIQITMRGSHKGLHCTWRGMEHIQERVDKGKKIRDHVRYVIGRQKPLKAQEESEKGEGKEFDYAEELRKCSCADSKEDRKRAFKLAKQDAKFAVIEAAADENKRTTDSALRASTAVSFGSKKSFAMSMIAPSNPMPAATRALMPVMSGVVEGATTATSSASSAVLGATVTTSRIVTGAVFDATSTTTGLVTGAVVGATVATTSASSAVLGATMSTTKKVTNAVVGATATTTGMMSAAVTAPLRGASTTLQAVSKLSGRTRSHNTAAA